MYQCRFITCNKYTCWWGDGNNEEAYASIGAGSIWEICVLSYFCYEPKTVAYARVCVCMCIKQQIL